MNPRLLASLIVFMFLFNANALCSSAKLKARGMITSIHQPVISSQISAKITDIPFNEGDFFKKGDPLIIFEKKLLEAQQEKTIAQLEAAQIILDNKKELEELNSVAAIEVNLAAAEVKKMNAEKKISDIALSRTIIKAPFNGRVAQIFVNEHETVSNNQKLIEIVSTDQLEIKVMVPSMWLEWLKPKIFFNAHVDDINFNTGGNIKAIGAVVDPVSKMILIRGKLNKKTTSLLPGMSADVIFKSDN